MKHIYLDHASTTPVDPEVVKAMQPYFTKKYGNASSLHAFGREAYDALDESRNQVASLIHARKQEIIFTAGGTEADNMALKGLARVYQDRKEKKGPHIITSAIEHPAILEPCRYLEKQGFTVEYLSVDDQGIIDLDQLQETISKNTFLISIMAANNEIGTIQPIEQIGKLARDHEILFHTDAVQAIGKIPVNVQKMRIDLLSMSSHKIYGPKGVGALFLGEGIRINPLVHGGGHERGLRSTTENIPGVVGFAKACELAGKRMDQDVPYLKHLRDKLIKNIGSIEESYLNGHRTKRLVNNAHFRFSAVEGESLLLHLDDNGIAAATGSACSSKKLQASHVLVALGVPQEEAHGSLRLTLGRGNTEEEIDKTIEVLPKIIERLRMMSPLWNK